MSPEQAESLIIALEHDQEKAQIVADLARLTPDVMYHSISLQEKNGHTIKQIYAASAAAYETLHLGDNKSTEGHVVFKLKDNEEVKTQLCVPSARITFDIDKADDDISNAIQTLRSVEPKKLRKILGRIIDTTASVVILQPTIFNKTVNSGYKYLTLATAADTEPGTTYKYSFSAFTAGEPERLIIFQAIIFRPGGPVPEGKAPLFRVDCDWNLHKEIDEFVQE